MDLEFRPLTIADIPALARWLGELHVESWWKEPADLDAVERNYLPSVRGDDPTELFVVEVEGRGVGMIQRARVADDPEWTAALRPAEVDLHGAAAIDYLIGVPELVGRGIGTVMVERFVNRLFEEWQDVEQVIVAPQAANRASCRVLEKVGFTRVWTGILDSDDPSDAGVAALYVLRRA